MLLYAEVTVAVTSSARMLTSHRIIQSTWRKVGSRFITFHCICIYLHAITFNVCPVASQGYCPCNAMLAIFQRRMVSVQGEVMYVALPVDGAGSSRHFATCNNAVACTKLVCLIHPCRPNSRVF